MFGSKPWPIKPEGTSMEDTKCDGPWAFQPWMVQLQSYGVAPDTTDPWQRGIVRLQYLPPGPQDPNDLLKEKNWNPFIYKGQLYFSQVRTMPGSAGAAAVWWRVSRPSCRGCLQLTCAGEHTVNSKHAGSLPFARIYACLAAI
jgi:hypothetical protein